MDAYYSLEDSQRLLCGVAGFFFAGSGTTGAAAAKHDRSFILVDESVSAIAVMEKRLAPYDPRKEKLPRPKTKKTKSAPASRRSRQ